MHFTRLWCLALSLWCGPLASEAAAPKNDKLSKAMALTGTSGEVLEATNVDATFETKISEPSVGGAGQTVWYSFTAPASGYLIISSDRTNSAGGAVLPAAYAVVKGMGLTNFYPPFDFDIPLGRRLTTVGLVKGQVVKLQFDHDPEFPTVAPGAFTFSYRFLTGANFIVQGETRRNQLFAWNEAAGSMVLTIARVGDTQGAASVDYELQDLDGEVATDLDSPGADPYTGTLNFEPGESRKTLTFPILNDLLVEGDEYLALALSNPSEGNLVTYRKTFLIIEDDEGTTAQDHWAGALNFNQAVLNLGFAAQTGTTEPEEPVGPAKSVWVKWTAPATGLVTASTNHGERIAAFTGSSLATLQVVPPVDAFVPPLYASPGGLAGPVVFPVVGGTLYSFAISDTEVSNGGLSFNLNLKSVASGASASSFRFAAELSETAENTTAKIIILRGGNTQGTATVSFTTSLTVEDPEDADYFDANEFATPGTDYTVTTQEVTFLAGENRVIVTVPIARDSLKEGNERFYVRLATTQTDCVVDYPAHAQVNIYDKLPAMKAPPFSKATFAGGLHRLTGPGGEGSISVKLGAGGSFTGTLILDGKKVTLKGALPELATGEPGDQSDLTLHFPRTGLADIVVELLYSIDDSYSGHLTGTVADGVSTADFTAHRPGYLVPQHLVGRYTAVLIPDVNVPAEIRQPGYLTMDVSLTGGVKIVGGLPDGTKVSGSGFLTFTGFNPYLGSFVDVVFSLPLYKKTGHLTGQFHLGFPNDPRPVPPSGDGEGTVHWVHPTLAKGTVLAPFVADFDSFVSRFAVPKGALAFAVPAPSSIGLTFEGGDLDPTTIAGTFSTKGSVTFPPATAGKPSLKFDAKTGLFSGKYTPPDSTKALSFQGAISRNRSDATGYFLNGTSAGKVIVRFP